ncbi:hypothetical protein EV189_1266 [Motilibacter rhizosphaerae]|uniref:Uncharacterized protein n=1 Tax=Motilibacter rhizosphaerae TaxID=598652 RepID=A0A4V2F4J1_9ACTN|nr:hypothetical protein [Motilibacter rhizosphaerae]RZS89499.1 hypothetical protein EV189_1266 [Motilibacter rhizosphaerae]
MSIPTGPGSSADDDAGIVPVLPAPTSTPAMATNPGFLAADAEGADGAGPEDEAQASGEREPGGSDGPEGGFTAPV